MINSVKIDSNQCIGCGGCERTCSSVFQLTHKVHARVVGRNFEHHAQKVLAAYRNCPVQVIELVSDDVSLQTTWYSARISGKQMISQTVMEVRLACDMKPDFKPGQHITVRFRDDIGYFNRAYSVVDFRDGKITLNVTLMEDGRGSSFFHLYEIGSEVEITEPRGDFVVRDTDNPKVFVATGAGLAPIMAMIEGCPSAKKTLYFGQRNERELFYRERLAQIPNLEIKYCLDFAEEDWKGLRGRVTGHVKNDPLTKYTEVYACGGTAMLEDLDRVLRKKRHPKGLFFKESFMAAGASLSGGSLLWRWWVRSIHVYFSIILAFLFLFFGFTGFVASRPELFPSDKQKTVPENIAMEQGELAGFFKTRFGVTFALERFHKEDGLAVVELKNSENVRQVIEVDEESRGYFATEIRPLPSGIEEADKVSLAEALSADLPGKLENESIEVDGDTVYFNLESVWSKCAVMVNLANQEYQINRESVPWMKALVLLHKGKQAEGLQRILIDAAGLGMMIVTLSGVVLAFQSSGVIRVMAVSLLATSIALLLLMWVGR